jgi:hypothetical protein
MEKLAIIIPTFNRKKHLQELLNCLNNQTLKISVGRNKNLKVYNISNKYIKIYTMLNQFFHN